MYVSYNYLKALVTWLIIFLNINISSAKSFFCNGLTPLLSTASWLWSLFLEQKHACDSTNYGTEKLFGDPSSNRIFVQLWLHTRVRLREAKGGGSLSSSYTIVVYRTHTMSLGSKIIEEEEGTIVFVIY